MANGNLIPTPITDKNGKATTVYRSAEAPQQAQKTSIPAPVVQAQTVEHKEHPADSESYAERKRRILEESNAEETPESIAAKAELAVKVFPSVQNLMMSLSSCMDSSEREDFAFQIGELAAHKEFEAIGLSDRFADVYNTIVNSSDEDDTLDIDFSGEDTSDWESEYVGIRDHLKIIDVVFALRDQHLMSPTEVPEHGEPRFFAHLYMSASKRINYRDDDDETLALIRLVDEYPERTEMIAEGLEKGVHSEGIKSLLNGNVSKGVASGVL